MTNQELNLAVAKACGCRIIDQRLYAGERCPLEEYTPGVLLKRWYSDSDTGWELTEATSGLPSWDPANDVNIAIECIKKLGASISMCGYPGDKGMQWRVVLGQSHDRCSGGLDEDLARAICLAIVGLGQ